MLSGLYYWALLPFVAPLVGTHPVLLEVLNGNTAAIISAAAFVRIGHGSLVVVLLAALPGLMKFDILYWWAGRLWGERIIALLSGRRNRGGRYMARVQRWGRKFTWPAVLVAQFLPIPTAIIYVVVGWAGMRLVTFLILDAIGTLLWAGLLAGLGYELGHHAVVVAQTISHYGLWISIALIVVIVFFQVRSQRHMLSVARQARSAAAQASRGDEAGADRGPGEGDHSRADRCLAPLVSRGRPALAYAVVRDGDAALGGFGGAGPRTIFEIGSLTKVFTALLLADMAERGQVRLSDSAARYLPGAARAR